MPEERADYTIEVPTEELPEYLRLLADEAAALAEYRQLCRGIEDVDELAAFIEGDPPHMTEARRDACLEAIRTMRAVDRFSREHAAD